MSPGRAKLRAKTTITTILLFGLFVIVIISLVMQSYNDTLERKESSTYMSRQNGIRAGELGVFGDRGDVMRELEDEDYQVLFPYIAENHWPSENKADNKIIEYSEGIMNYDDVAHEKQAGSKVTHENKKAAVVKHPQKGSTSGSSSLVSSKNNVKNKSHQHRRNESRLSSRLLENEYDNIEDVFKDDVKDYRSHITIFNQTIGNASGYDCRTVYALSPAPPICIHDTACDRPVSDSIKHYGVWAGRETVFLLDLLKNNPALHLVDIGCNVGQLTVLAASLGRHALAVDANIENVRRLKRSVELGGYGDHVTILHNLIYDKRAICDVTIGQTNQAEVRIAEPHPDDDDAVSNDQNKLSRCNMKTRDKVKSILMNDLLEVIDFNHTVLSIGSLGNEHKIFRFAGALLDHVDAPYILVQWTQLRMMYIGRDHHSRDKELVEQMVGSLHLRDYLVYSLVTGLQLDMSSWAVWPENVVFIREDIEVQVPLELRD